jgi:hypothetical protein
VAVNKKDALVQGLGKFRCSACKKVAKVTVSKYVAPAVENRPYFDVALVAAAIVAEVPVA